jgi:hypothetical protein
LPAFTGKAYRYGPAFFDADAFADGFADAFAEAEVDGAAPDGARLDGAASADGVADAVVGETNTGVA